MIKPYFEEAGIRIFCGDNREILPELGRYDLCLTDPPYPKLKGNLTVNLTSGVGTNYNRNKTVGLPWGDDITILADVWNMVDKGMMVFCSFHTVAEVPALIGADPCALVTWYQRNAMPPMNNAPHFQSEFIWAFRKNPGLKWRKLKTMYDVARLQTGCMATERIVDSQDCAVHPSQKPLALMRSLLMVEPASVIDPYIGTGTTLRACKDLGLACDGIDISEKYCEIAANRLRQSVLQFE